MNLVLTASSQTPLVDATVVITATVTNNGEPVPNGTAVEFQASAGVLNGGGQAALKTTTGGIATVTLTSGTAQVVRVTATVNNVTRQIDITFQARTNPPPPPNTAPTITGVNPAVGRPQGGQVIRITGTNFRAPVRVLFDTGGATPIEGSVQLVTDTLIEVVTPPVNLGAGQQLAADVIVFTQAGTANEQRVEASGAFTFRNEQLQPIVYTVSPNSGPVVGGTRVTIFGEGFQAPVQVLFGTAEARVLNVNYDRIEVETPAGRDTTPGGSDPTTGPVPVTVRNINSNLSGEMEAGFHYKQAVIITGVAPIVSASTGGQQVIIDGAGFVAPVDVVISGIRAQVLEVSGTRLVVRTGPLASPCATAAAGPVIVNNVVNGDSDIWGDEANETSFSYIPVEPRIIDVDLPPAPVEPGETVTVVVRDPGTNSLGVADIGFALEGRTVIPSPNRITIGSGEQTFTFAIPSNITFPTVGCTVGSVSGTQFGPADLDITFLNLTTGCDDILVDAIRVVPDPLTNPCVVPPADVEQVLPTPPSCADAGSETAASGTNTAPIRFRNTGGETLTIQANPVTGVDAADFTISPASHLVAPGAIVEFTVTFDPSAVGARQADVTFTTDDPDVGEQTISVCLRGTGT